MSRHNENQIATERLANQTPNPHVVPQMEIDEGEPQTATFKNMKRMVIGWMFRAIGVVVIFSGGVLWRHEITLTEISQTVVEMKSTLKEMQADQRDNNRLLIQLMRERGGP